MDHRNSQHVAVMLGWIFSGNEQSAVSVTCWETRHHLYPGQTSHTGSAAKSTIHLIETSQREGSLHTATQPTLHCRAQQTDGVGGG